MASSFPGQVTAVQVGSYFVGQYYQILQQRPDFAHQFYSDASAMIRVDGDSAESVSGMMQIHSLLTNLNFTGIEIKTAHSLDSWNGAVLVVVSGFVQTKNYSVRRKFMQTFLLAPQEKGYFILNDLFHFLEEEQVQHYPSSLLAHSNFDPQSNFDHTNFESKLSTPNLSPKPVTNYVLGGEVESDDLIDSDLANTVQAEESEIVDKYSFSEAQPPVPEPEDVIEEIPLEEPVDSFSNVVETVRDLPPVLPEEPVREPQKQTYASVLRIARGQPAHSTSHPPALNKVPPVTAEWQNVPQSVPQPVFSAGNEKFNFDATEEAFIPEDEGDAKSVYVGNLPASISVADLEQEFKNFGRIKPDGVTIRNRKEAGVYYAFVEFEDVYGVQNALKATPIEINGRQIHVEARRPNSGAIRGRRGRGRGGYQSDVPRGRFGGRTFTRGGIQHNNDRDYNNRSRGNGYPQRGGAYQERGILGSQYESNY
ncbi:NTF2-like protein [Dioscorea alata]|uniref:NTF2-like protein n=1 Tax=Dioscorea alata TaxID=55571 RepID=A0ACB7WR38_DIOAL|nr:NTF2-like protein [Dioscorea alata]